MDEKFNEFRKYLRDDVAHVLHLYNQKNSFRYEEFVQVWNELKFYQLLSLFYYYPILYREFIKDALKISLEYLCDELDLEVRTGALYLLYGIYFHQVELPKMKIQVTTEQWIEILKFIEQITQNEENVDIEYIFRCLLHSNAFEFCAVSSDLKGITNQYMAQKPRAKKDESKIDLNAMMDEFKKDLLENPLIDELSTIHETYVQMKADFASNSNTNDIPLRALNTITQDINELICLGVRNEADRETIDEDNDEKDDEEETSEDRPKAGDSVLSRRMRVRQKAARMVKGAAAADDSD